jgi:hypothetical protein
MLFPLLVMLVSVVILTMEFRGRLEDSAGGPPVDVLRQELGKDEDSKRRDQEKRFV